MTASVVNAWAGSIGQGTTFTSITSALPSTVVQLNAGSSVGGGSGTASSNNWLFAIASWTQAPAIAEVHVGVNDDIRSWWREFPASSASGSVRTSISYTPNLARVPGYVYVAPDGGVAATNVLVVEVSGLGPWDTVSAGAPDTNYAGAATALTLSLGAPGAASFFIAGVGGDSTAATQAFAPSGWTTLHTLSQSDGTDQLASNVLTSAYLASSSSSQSVAASAGSATDLSGFLIGVYVTGTDPIPALNNPNWPYVKFEAGFGSGFNTADSEVTWTDLTSRLWNWDETTGIQFQLGQLQSTNLTTECDNFDAYLSPLNSSSPYFPHVVPGTPIRMRMAFGTIGGVTVNRWYVIQRNIQEVTEQIDDTYRRFVQITGSDIWASLSSVPPTFYRTEVYVNSPYAWWPCDDQPLDSNVLPTILQNAAVANTNTLAINASSNGVSAEQQYTATGIHVGGSGGVSAGESVAIYSVGTDAGWLFGDPQGQAPTLGTGNPVTSYPGSASWAQAGEVGNNGEHGWYLTCNDTSFPVLANGITVKGWFNASFYGTAQGWFDSGSGTISNIVEQPYNIPITLCTLSTGSAPVCVLQLSAAGALNLITYNGATPTSHSIYSTSDLRCNSWVAVDITLTTTAWRVYVNGGQTANVSGTATGMTSAWTWLTLNGDYGTAGGSTPADIQHSGNVAYAHWAVFPYILPYYRIMAHYWAGITAFGQLPAPSVTIATASTPPPPGGGADSTQYGQYTADGALDTGSYGSTLISSSAFTFSALATANAGSYTSGPSARSIVAAYGTDYSGTFKGYAVWVGVTGTAPLFQIYTAAAADAETEASSECGAGDAYSTGYGSGATSGGVCNVAGGTGASPPTSASSIGDTVAQRIERLICGGNATGNGSSPNRCIDSTATQLVQAPGNQGGGIQCGASIQEIQQSDNGFLAVDNLNNLFYWSRPHLASQYSNPVWKLGPTTGSGETPYYPEIKWITDPQRVWNAISVAPFSPTGAELPLVTPTNASAVQASQAQYGAQPYQVISWLQSASEQLAQANFLFTNYGVPQRRAENVKVDAAPYPAAWPLVAAISVGDVVTLEDWQVGGGGTNYTYRVTEIRRHVSFGAHESDVTAQVELTLDYEPSSYFS